MHTFVVNTAFINDVSLRHDSGLKGSFSGSMFNTLQQAAEVKF